VVGLRKPGKNSRREKPRKILEKKKEGDDGRSRARQSEGSIHRQDSEKVRPRTIIGEGPLKADRKGSSQNYLTSCERSSGAPLGG